ncbi:MAG: SulP family inorganic anion transporter [Proteobacteria bacterium]|jgi:SulP family sulfate permease|nr:SulP family inorganic anion transporter [Pseudomonadota bacterium]
MTPIVPRSVRLLQRAFPFVAWLLPADRSALRRDVVAGITVALVAIPQSLAYAQLAGVPAYYGLYAAFLPAIVGALWGSSPQLSTGPVAMTSLLTAASLMPIARIGSDAFVHGAVVLALLSGVFQIAFGALRLGMLLNLLSHPVLMGFINAAAIIISLSQLPGLIGVSARQSEHFLVDTWHVLLNLDLVHEWSLAFGIVALVLLVAFRRFAPKLPGVLVTVAVLTLASWWTGYAGKGGRVVGAIPASLPGFALPRFDWTTAIELVPPAFVIALISFMEAMSSSKVAAMKTKQAWNGNQELVGQGLAKIVGALNGTFPVSGSFSRSALNLAAGARTGLASIIAALLVAVTALFLGPLLFHLPKPVLAAIIVLAVYNLLNFGAIRRAWRASRADAAAAIITFATTLLFAPNIQNGILTGIIVSLALSLYRRMRPRAVEVGLHADGTLRDAARWKLAPLAPQVAALRFDDSLEFVNAAHFEDSVLRLAREHPGARFILIAAGGINEIDASGVEVVANLADHLAERGVTLVFSGLKQQVQRVFDRTGLTAKLGSSNLHATDRAAVEALVPRAGAGPTAATVA